MGSDDVKKAFRVALEMWEHQLAEHLAKPGWNKLEYNERIWKKFYEIYKFHPSTELRDWPSILEPIPSRTYNIGHVYGDDYECLTRHLSEFYLKCFREVIPKNEAVIVLDWQHQCYTLDPYAGFQFESIEEWPVSPLPNGDYYIFLKEDLSGGFFGHPWEQTICIMGEDFVAQLADAPNSVFSNIVRVDGENAN